MRTLEDRVAVVTGAGGGIGRATALALARRGCRLALVDVSADGLDGSQRQVEAAGGKASVHIADVSDPERMAQLPDEVVGQHGACHILVNNAGVLQVGRFTDDQLDDIRWIVGINVFGVIHGCHFFLPVLREADEAHIVNVSSMAAFVGIPQNAVYSLTKGAVRSFTEGLRAELVGSTIGVSALFPGSTDTNIMRGSRGTESARLNSLADKSIVHLFSSSPEAAGRKIVRAIEHDRARVLLGPDARALDLSARILPGRTGLIGRALDRVTR
jgi:short-subunit dehydrogenase